MIGINTLLLVLVISFGIESSSTKIANSSSATIFGVRSAVHTESLTSPGLVTASHGDSLIPNAYYIAATDAKTDSADDVALDGAGNLFFSTGNHKILMVTASTGIVSVVAGTGEYGFGGDGSAATSAKLDGPSGLALDKFGNIFVADTFNHRIRKITLSTGIITTVAGSTGGRHQTAENDVLATDTTLYYPANVAVDTTGNIYIADTGNYCVRKVTASTGIITVIAGTGLSVFPPSPALGVAATLSSLVYPGGVTVDKSGNVFIVDEHYNSIYKITASTGLISLVAGANQAGGGYNGDGILATTALLNRPLYITVDTLGNIYFSDRGNSRFRKITASTGIITTVTADCWEYREQGQYATMARLCAPSGIAVDAAGTLYYCDNMLVRKDTYNEVTPSPAITQGPSMTPVSSITRSPTNAAPISAFIATSISTPGPPPTASMPSAPSITYGAPLSSPTVSMPSAPPTAYGAPRSSPTVSMPLAPPTAYGAPRSSPTASIPLAPSARPPLSASTPPVRGASSSTGTPSSSTQHTAGAHYLAMILLSSLLSLHIYREA